MPGYVKSDKKVTSFQESFTEPSGAPEIHWADHGQGIQCAQRQGTAVGGVTGAPE